MYIEFSVTVTGKLSVHGVFRFSANFRPLWRSSHFWHKLSSDDKSYCVGNNSFVKVRESLLQNPTHFWLSVGAGSCFWTNPSLKQAKDVKCDNHIFCLSIDIECLGSGQTNYLFSINTVQCLSLDKHLTFNDTERLSWTKYFHRYRVLYFWTNYFQRYI